MSFIDWLNGVFKKQLPPPVPPAPSDPPQIKAYKLAQGEVGVSEVQGDKNNPRILEYHKSTDLKATEDSTPWCSAFMNWCIKKAGLPGTDDAMARSWLSWGKRVDMPKEGDIVVFSSPLRGSIAGHVAFFVEEASPGFIFVLGGNQKDSVCVEKRATTFVLGYRRSLDA